LILARCSICPWLAGLRAKEQWQNGDTVAIFSPNDVDYLVAMLGTPWAGASVSLVNPGYTASELEYQLVDSAEKLLVTHQSLLSMVLKVAKKIGFSEKKIFLLGDEQHARSTNTKHFKSIISSVPLVKPVVDPTNELSFLIYSSGSTGKPKGVMLTHRNIISNILIYPRSRWKIDLERWSQR
jgi:acyl-CoA synthetase (AMP-forming)/AMP-acid ligase II